MMLRVLLSVLLVIGTAASASAKLGSDAARGDNCTPFNSFEVGYGVSGGTIVSQSVVVANGWLAGWVLDTSSAKHYYVPNPGFFDHDLTENQIVAGPPVFVALEALNTEALGTAYRQARKARSDYSRHIDRDSPSSLPKASVIAPCFTRALSV